MRVFLVGDVHGDLQWATKMSHFARQHGCTIILQLGDFGYWPHTPSGQKFLGELEKVASSLGVTWHWIDGNHENHTHLNAVVNHRITPVPISKHIIYLPRGCRWEWAGKRFGALGGAFSIDWRGRVPEVSWWPQETITEDNVEALGNEPLDVLVTHDIPVDVRFEGILTLPPDDEWNARESRKRISEALAATTPQLLLHGHWHRPNRTQSAWIDKAETERNGNMTWKHVDVVGFASNIEDNAHSWGLLELPSLRVIAGSEMIPI